MRKKKLYSGILIVFCLISLIGCGNTGKKSDKQNDITSKSLSEAENSSTESIVEDLSYKEQCIKNIMEIAEESDDYTEEVVDGISDIYGKISNMKFAKIVDSEEFGLLEMYSSYLVAYFDESSIGYQIGDYGLECTESILEEDKETFKANWQLLTSVYSENICPLYKKKYDSGQYFVGEDIPQGEYVLFSNEEDDGYFSVSSDSNGDKIKFNDNFGYNSIISIKNGEYLELSYCYAIPIKDKMIDIPKKKGTMFKIGKHLKAGRYKLKSDNSDGGYYCIYDNSRHEHIVSNDNFENQRYITVKKGQYLFLSYCHIAK